jgi:hypothetical protein
VAKEKGNRKNKSIDASSKELVLQESVRQLSELLKQGQFHEGLKEVQILNDRLKRRRPAKSDKDYFTYLKGKALVAECFDYLGRYSDEREALKEDRPVLEEIMRRAPSDKLRDLSLPDKEVLREEIRVALNVIQAEEYRNHHYESAKSKLDHLYVLADKLKTDSFKCLGTRAQILYYLGNTSRQLNDYRGAEQCFARSLEFYRERAQQKNEEFQDDPQALKAYKDFHTYRAAVCIGLGIGWTAYSVGQLFRAQSLIAAARLTMMDSPARFNRAYLDLVYVACRRAMTGDDGHEALSELEQVARNAHRTFSEPPAPHLSYSVRAAHELALILLQMDKLGEAESVVTEAMKKAEETHDRRWVSNCLVVLSRIARRKDQFELAREHADGALKWASESARRAQQILPTIDALIARAEAGWRSVASARYSREENQKVLTQAEQDLGQALKLNEGTVDSRTGGDLNPKITAVCLLNRAAVYVQMHQNYFALQELKKCDLLIGEVEHISVRRLAWEVQKLLDKIDTDFVVLGPISDREGIKSDDLSHALRGYLVRQVDQMPLSESEKAKKLDIKLPTLRYWRKWYKDLFVYPGNVVRSALQPSDSMVKNEVPDQEK